MPGRKLDVEGVLFDGMSKDERTCAARASEFADDLSLGGGAAARQLQKF